MIDVRPAVAEDAPELIRLRGVMLVSQSGTEPVPGPWQESAVQALRMRLVDGSLAAFVVDAPDEPGRLAACVVGTIEQRLAGPANLSGKVGYVFSVATDPGHRRRGYSRACMTELLDWFRRAGVVTVDLKASREAEPLYRSLGFVRTAAPAMRLTL